MLGERKTVQICILSVIPVFAALFSVFGPFLTDTVYLYSGLAVHVRPTILPGYPTIDPNVGETSFALGARATFDIFSGHIPLWNHYEGLGMPLLGETMSAALFPPTWLLVIPNGQAIELAFLQFVAGAGAFLFFRKFGLGTTAALAGSLLFEVNGVFAWLRSAIYNPVAFLPWILFAIECLRSVALAKRTFRKRTPLICLGAVVAAAALYAGFPEQVYLYALLLIAWVLFRMTGLSVRDNLTFGGDLCLTGLIALALSAPLLIAFVDFLGEAGLERHADDGYYGIWLNSGAIIQYIMPYIFGPIFFELDHLTLVKIWASTGGYIGFVPIVLAVAGLFVRDRRAVKIFLVGWVIVALGATHGLPGVYRAFMTLPLVKIAACYRYLNPSWIFCIVFLAALFVDSVPALPQLVLRRILGWAVTCGLIFVVAAAVGAWPLIPELWIGSLTHQAFIAGALLAVAFLSICILRTGYCSHARAAAVGLSGVMIAEALIWFLVPFLSYPRDGTLDDDVIAFLKTNIGYQRVVNTTEASLSPNYGSFFGIPLLNYDDMAAPKITGKYIKEMLDPYAQSNVFVPSFPNLSTQEQADRKSLFHARLFRYAEIGVKYLLAGPDFNFDPAFLLSPTANYPYGLATGQRVEISAEPTAPVVVTAVSLVVGTSSNTSTGHLKVTFCAGVTCAESVADLGQAEDNRPLSFTLDRPVQIGPGNTYKILVEKLDGEKEVALWMFPLASTDTTTTIIGTPTPVRDKYVPDLRLASDVNAKLIRRSRSMSIYELSGVRDYFSADSCTLHVLSHDRVDAACARPSKLVRLEAYMPGWSAIIDGKPVLVSLSDDVFQTIDLPAGEARIEFAYEPPGFKPALAAAGVALLLILIGLVKAIRVENRGSFVLGGRVSERDV